ncbi:hypothetical protein BDW67DRAFT_181427 [Aspergillus spinulosporus]
MKTWQTASGTTASSPNPSKLFTFFSLLSQVGPMILAASLRAWSPSDCREHAQQYSKSCLQLLHAPESIRMLSSIRELCLDGLLPEERNIEASVMAALVQAQHPGWLCRLPASNLAHWRTPTGMGTAGQRRALSLAALDLVDIGHAPSAVNSHCVGAFLAIPERLPHPAWPRLASFTVEYAGDKLSRKYRKYLFEPDRTGARWTPLVKDRNRQVKTGA